MSKITTKVGLDDLLEDQINPATEETLQAIAGLVDVEYDTVEVNYTTPDKDVISSVIFSLNAVVVKTITATYPTTTKEIYTTL